MATLGTTVPTLLDVAKRMDPDGKTPFIAEMLTKVNPILEDIPFIEGNTQTGHQGVIRTGLPTVAWRLLNFGTISSKSKTKQVTDVCGIMEAYSEIDKILWELNGAGDGFRMTEDSAHVEAMGQELASTIFYGNTAVNPEKFLGLDARYSDISAENGGQIIDDGGTGNDLTSIWLIGWGPRTIHGIFPKGTMAGLQMQNLGEQTKYDSVTGRLMQVMRSRFQQNAGLHLKDWEGVVRIANIETADLATAGTSGYTGPDIVFLMKQAIYKMPLRLRKQGNIGGKLVFYVAPEVHEALVSLAMFDKVQASTLRIEQLETGEPMLKFWGHPVRECDALLLTEAEIT